jgi:hypothetical protein
MRHFINDACQFADESAFHIRNNSLKNLEVVAE